MIDGSEERTAPRCTQCHALLDIEKTMICPDCSAENTTFPAPQWLREYMVNGEVPEQIFCAEIEGHGSFEDGLKPVLIKCAACNASLKITTKTPRSATCEHCGTTQFLPDQLWIALHPVKKSREWFIKFGSD